mmetsp:Transcript_9640/g.23168  ORF Transcript_9640/g.23168 Transcript_9640/m.23168 type:complete len:81 (-) Transcript_9640:1447-1689(-)
MTGTATATALWAAVVSWAVIVWHPPSPRPACGCKVVAEGGHYKPNCAIVIIDFLMRHGYVAPEEEGYLELLAGLRQGECS